MAVTHKIFTTRQHCPCVPSCHNACIVYPFVTSFAQSCSILLAPNIGGALANVTDEPFVSIELAGETVHVVNGQQKR